MSSDSPPIIAEPTEPRAPGWCFWAVLCGAAVSGAIAAAWFAWQDLTLSHYDARAHLVVARRVIDSLTPGWRQIGAVWLPLPHAIQVLPMQWDVLYRTGLSGVAVSVGALAFGLAAIGERITRRSGSVAAGILPAVLVLGNPSVLYLQSTPMTEPLLFGLSLLALARVDAWVEQPTPHAARRAGWVILGLMLTRYEGWFIAGALVVVGAIATRERGARTALSLAPWAAGAIVGFLSLSRITVGNWFVASGFFVADNPLRHQPLAVLQEMIAIAADIGGPALLVAGGAGAALCLVRARLRAAAALPLALSAAGALPFIAFVQGHPTRVRYLVPVVIAAAVLAALAVAALPRRLRGLAAVLLVSVVLWQRPPLSAAAPMVREAQWETPYRIGRQAVTAKILEAWDGTPILASMGSLAHYMQEVSAAGLGVRDFLHEGNYYLWEAALGSPRRHVKWMLIEERAEGGDVLAARARADADFLEGFDRMAEGGGVVLYRRRN